MLRLSLDSAFRQKMKENIKNPAEIPDIGCSTLMGRNSQGSEQSPVCIPWAPSPAFRVWGLLLVLAAAPRGSIQPRVTLGSPWSS